MLDTAMLGDVGAEKMPDALIFPHWPTQRYAGGGGLKEAPTFLIKQAPSKSWLSLGAIHSARNVNGLAGVKEYRLVRGSANQKRARQRGQD